MGVSRSTTKVNGANFKLSSKGVSRVSAQLAMILAWTIKQSEEEMAQNWGRDTYRNRPVQLWTWASWENCILQHMKSNSRLCHKYFCRRKSCFTFLGPLCILISFSGAAAVVMLLKGMFNIRCILSYFPFCLMWIFINCLVQ